MDTIAVKAFCDELIKAFETSETYNNLVSSTDKDRCFKVTREKVQAYRERLAKLLAQHESNSTKENRAGVREEDLQGESV
jgi:hypothetical protein